MSRLLNRQTIEDLSVLLKNKEVSPVEITQDVLGEIERLDSDLNSYIKVTEEKALKSAKDAEKEILDGNYRGPLHGIPMGIKDNIYFEESVTTMGSKIHQNFAPSYDATVVKKLRKSGVIFTGKLNLHEYAWGATNNNPHFGACHNPWDLNRITGGSSGGSGAAVSSHLSIASLGTDTGGSIRIPSSFCGIVGLKPTHGLVSNYGSFPLAWSLDHIGPMTKTVKDSAYLLESISGSDSKDPRNSTHESKKYANLFNGDIKGMRIGVNENYFFNNVDKPVESLVRKALLDLEKEGAILVDVDISYMEYAEFADLATIMVEPSTIHYNNIRKRPNDFGEDVRTSLRVGELYSASDYLQAQQIRENLKNEYSKLFKNVDVLITPTLPFLPPKIGEETAIINGKQVFYPYEIIRFTGPFNLTGLPALSIPCGFADELPVGMQIVGPAYHEEVIYNVAYAYERLQKQNTFRTPPIVENYN